MKPPQCGTSLRRTSLGPTILFVVERVSSGQGLIGASLSEPHIDWDNGPRGGE